MKNLAILTLFTVFFLQSCDKAISPKVLARVKLESKNNSSVNGIGLMEQKEDFLSLKLKVTGLSPNKHHAIHIHQKPDCSSSDAKSAGGHFSPRDHKHGSPNSQTSHAGDLGNIKADEKGHVQINIKTKKISLIERSETFIGNRSLIIHEGEDDFSSQPSGNAGKRIACAIIDIQGIEMR